MSGHLPPRPDLTVPKVRRDPTVWVATALFLIGGLASAQLLVAPSAPPVARPSEHPSPDPRPSVDAATVPTGPDGAFAFLEATYVDGKRVPVRWNPCQPIEYQIDLEDAPPGTPSAIAGAVEQASAATRIPFRSLGATTQDTHVLLNHAYFANALRAVYRPVLIDVVSHREFRTYGQARRVLAFAHPERGNGTLDDQYVAGVVVVDGGARYAASGRWSLQLVIQHELGHLLGLAHVRDGEELMFSIEVARHTVPASISGWGPGDLEGLERLGADQGCLERVRVAG
jgi:hypothetical protein